MFDDSELLGGPMDRLISDYSPLFGAAAWLVLGVVLFLFFRQGSIIIGDFLDRRKVFGGTISQRPKDRAAAHRHAHAARHPARLRRSGVRTLVYMGMVAVSLCSLVIWLLLRLNVPPL